MINPCARPRLGVRRSAKRRDSACFLRNGFQILDDRPAFFFGQQRSDDAVSARAILEGMTRIRISPQSRVHR